MALVNTLAANNPLLGLGGTNSDSLAALNIGHLAVDTKEVANVSSGEVDLGDAQAVGWTC